MILSSAREFEKYSNPEIVERESDNVEMPSVREMKFFVCYMTKWN
jgi:hypothetical protein